jgi:GNAT superfamily N-acetyltransferase
LRQFETRDVEAFQALLTAAGMPPCPLDYWNPRILSDGFFVIEHTATAALVATCFASHHPTMRHDRAGNFGWLAADPAHKGRKLGWTVSAAVTARLIAAGYKRIYLETHDFRLAALKIYTSMGWVPLPYDADMERRWRTVYETLRLPFTPGVWPR